MPEPVEAAPKKIILCCDGTSQSSVNGEVSLPSNITRIARNIAKAGRDGDKVWQQLVFYDAGVGTGSSSMIESLRQGATGDGLIINVLEAYNFVVNNYSPGDKIYCFGFSRGAFTARAIAGMITDFGVIKPDQMKHFPSLFAAYQKNTKKYNFRKTKEYFELYEGKAPFVPESEKETVYRTIPFYDTRLGQIEYDNSRSVELVGVFDTVGSLGLGDTWIHKHASNRRQYEWLNVKWNPYIKHAFHALALDDRRQPFLPTLYYIPKDEVIAAENKILKEEEVDWPELTEHRRRVDEELSQAMAEQQHDLVQVWFTGVHINVGGGTDEEGKEEERTDEAKKDEAKKDGAETEEGKKDGGKTDLEGLSNLTFAWMVEQCRPYLAFEDSTNSSIANYPGRMKEFDVIQKARKRETPSMKEKAVNSINETGKWLGSFIYSNEKAVPGEKKVRSYCYNAGEVPTYEPAHWTNFRAQDSYTPFYKVISGAVDRQPGTCDDRSTEDHKPLSELGRTNEWMHPSVQWRILMSKKAKQELQDQQDLQAKQGLTAKQILQAKRDLKAKQDLQYESKPLGAFDYIQKNGMYGWQHKKEKDEKGEKVWIPEWPITAALKDADTSTYSDNAEMALIEACKDHDDVRKFLKEHAAAWQKAQAVAN